jgi:hypothetical protein
MHKLAEKYGEAFHESPALRNQDGTFSSQHSNLNSSPLISEHDRRERQAALLRQLEELENMEVAKPGESNDNVTQS